MKKLLYISLLVTLLAGCASHKTVQDPGAAYKGKSEVELYNGAENALIKGHYASAVKKFEALDALYPFGPHAEQGQLDIIYAYYESNDAPSTLAAADRYIHLYPTSPYIDYAYYMRGLAQFYQNRGFLETNFSTDYAQRNLGPLHHSFMDFSVLVNNYPNSPYVPDATQRMIYIRNMMAQHLLEVSNFYYERGAYVAAANRATEVIEHFQETTAVQSALLLLTESYIHLKNPAAAERAFNVLALNYPHNPSLPALKRRLQQLKR